MESYVERLRTSDPVPVEELLQGDNAVSEQLVQLVAEEHAIEDTIYTLSKGLSQGKLDLESYLKVSSLFLSLSLLVQSALFTSSTLSNPSQNVRTLGREQYLTRSLAELCRNTLATSLLSNRGAG